MKEILATNKRRERRAKHVRRRIRMTSDRPRLSVHRSSKHIYAQIIDDAAGRTLASASSTSKALSDQADGKSKSDVAAAVGSEIAKRAADAGVKEVVFDRGGRKYHGRIKALADAAREGGLSF